jgi:hypothetical protein
MKTTIKRRKTQLNGIISAPRRRCLAAPAAGVGLAAVRPNASSRTARVPGAGSAPRTASICTVNAMDGAATPTPAASPAPSWQNTPPPGNKGGTTPMLTPPRPVVAGGKPDRVMVYTRVRPMADAPGATEGTPRPSTPGPAGAAAAVRVDAEACQVSVRDAAPRPAPRRLSLQSPRRGTAVADPSPCARGGRARCNTTRAAHLPALPHTIPHTHTSPFSAARLP